MRASAETSIDHLPVLRFCIVAKKAAPLEGLGGRRRSIQLIGPRAKTKRGLMAPFFYPLSEIVRLRDSLVPKTGVAIADSGYLHCATRGARAISPADCGAVPAPVTSTSISTDVTSSTRWAASSAFFLIAESLTWPASFTTP
jgi:hypothetical protein